MSTYFFCNFVDDSVFVSGAQPNGKPLVGQGLVEYLGSRVEGRKNYDFASLYNETIESS